MILTVRGSDAALPALLLNSHMGVVPATGEKWTRDPFGGELVDGRIYGRGSQDMKCIGIGYIEAVRRLKAKGHWFRRTVHLSFVPDEEIGGADGMKAFVATSVFRQLNVGLALDEGVPSPNNIVYLYSGERASWFVKIKATGNAGHGSAFVQGTAVERILVVLQRIQEFRDQQLKKVTRSSDLWRDMGRMTSVNVTMLEAGKQINVIPDEACACRRFPSRHCL